MSITKAQFVTNYLQAEKRAKPSNRGVSFLVKDRAELNEQRKQLGLCSARAAELVMSGSPFSRLDYSKHWNRFNMFEAQAKRGQFIMAPSPTGRIVQSQPEIQSLPGVSPVKVKARAELQTDFNELTGRLIKMGITTVDGASSYLHNGFEFHRSEQKVGTRVTRIIDELRMGDLSKDQQLAVLDRAKAALTA